jgi:hypothetical protein
MLTVSAPACSGKLPAVTWLSFNGFITSTGRVMHPARPMTIIITNTD